MSIDASRPSTPTIARQVVRYALADRSPLHVPAPTQDERREREQADAAGIPYLLFRDYRDRQTIVALEDARVIIGRDIGAGVSIPWDPGVSRSRARLVRDGAGQWAIEDCGSTNGTYVSRVRIREPRRLSDRDFLQVGDTPIAFCAGRRNGPR